MAGRPPAGSTPTSALRVEVLKELQSIVDDREVRDRIDRGLLAETKGREHWVLHLLLRGQEFSHSQLTTLIGSAYSNLTARLQSADDRIQHLETSSDNLAREVKSRFEGLEAALAERVTSEVDSAFDRLSQRLVTVLVDNLEAKWRPVGDSVETFARSSHQLTRDLSDTYRVSTQTRLLLNENSRRMIDLGRDLVALEESLKLHLTRALEGTLRTLEERVAALERRRGPSDGSSMPPTATEPASPG
jgi:hypothetical protein